MWPRWLSRRSEPEPVAAPAASPQTARAEVLVRRLEWTVLRRLDGLLQGDHRTLMRGAGLDLTDLREYQLHDDVRHIDDWNVTARLQQPHVRVFTEDREMAAWFLMDLSPSVDFGSGTRRKSEVALSFVTVLGRLIGRHGNRVGAVLFGAGGPGGVDAVVPARGGRSHLLQIVQKVMTAVASPARDAAGGTQLAELLRVAGHVIRQRSTVFVVSDFISEPGWEAGLGALARRHDVVAVRLFDPLEIELPDAGLLPVRDAETGEQLWIDTSDRGFRQRFARIAAQREAQLREGLARCGVDTLELSTDDDLADAFTRFLDLRRQRSRRRAHRAVAPEGVPA